MVAYCGNSKITFTEAQNFGFGFNVGFSLDLAWSGIESKDVRQFCLSTKKLIRRTELSDNHSAFDL